MSPEKRIFLQTVLPSSTSWLRSRLLDLASSRIRSRSSKDFLAPLTRVLPPHPPYILPRPHMYRVAISNGVHMRASRITYMHTCERGAGLVMCMYMYVRTRISRNTRSSNPLLETPAHTMHCDMPLTAAPATLLAPRNLV